MHDSNSKWDLKEIGWNVVDWKHLAQDRTKGGLLRTPHRNVGAYNRLCSEFLDLTLEKGSALWDSLFSLQLILRYVPNIHNIAHVGRAPLGHKVLIHVTTTNKNYILNLLPFYE